MEIGDRIRIDDITGRVVALISEGKSVRPASKNDLARQGEFPSRAVINNSL